WVVDAIAPDTQILTKPSDPSNSSSANFTFSGSDSIVSSVAGFECKLDAASFAACTSPQVYSGLADGSHTFQVRALDNAGNVDQTPASYTWSIVTSVASSVTVGTGGDYTSLTNPGGLFETLNNSGASSSVTANIISDLTGETGAIALGQLPGGFGLTIKPSGAARTVSGNGAALGLIRLFGADNVTIDGSLSGGTDRSLTLNYGNTAGAAVWIGAASASDGSSGNTVKNCVISGSAGTTIVAGILSGSGSTFGNAAEAPNSNNTILNNSIYRVQNSVYLSGANGFDQNWNVTGNVLGSTVTADKNELRGLLISGAQAFTINGNQIGGVQSTPSTGAATVGIQLAGSLNGGFVVNNSVHDIKNVSPSGTGSFGIEVTSISPAANVTIANNFVWDVAAAGSASIASNGFGIAFDGAGAGGYRLYHNSVNLNTNQTSGTTAALYVSSNLNSAGALDVRNNIFANTQTAGADRYSVYSSASSSVFAAIDYNDYFAPNVGFISASPMATLSAWQAATTQDANSLAVDPRFVSAGDLHLRSNSPMVNIAVLIASITSDIDGQSRPIGPANDIGADEMIAFVNVFGRVVTAGGMPINGAKVSLAGGGSGSRRSALTSPFGYFSFNNVPTGGSLTIAVNSRIYTITNFFTVITPYTDTTIPNFVADPLP
ncbi:MAG: carboxypeptidase-like regulatory domain-containing protein, partial [Acidobacteriota bacterium]